MTAACWRAALTRAKTAAPWVIKGKKPFPLRVNALVQANVKRVTTIFKFTKNIQDIRVIDRLTRVIGQKVLLRHIGHIIALVIFRQQVVKWLVTLWSAVFGG